MAGKSHDPCVYLEAVCAMAVEAGERIMAVYERDFSVSSKQDGSPLTEADRASHQLIVSRLAELTPEIPVLSEESAAVDYEQRARWTRFWLVDPLDGTKEFISRNGQFTVNIALIERQRPVLGVVYVPVTRLAYYACRGQGAFKRLGDEPPQEIHVRPYSGGKAVVVASRSHAGDTLNGFLQRLGTKEGGPELASMGSSLKICLVAEGAADVYPRLGPTSEWDTAAAQCVAEQAGGQVLDRDKRPLRYNKTSILNPEFIVTGGGDYPWIELIND